MKSLARVQRGIEALFSSWGRRRLCLERGRFWIRVSQFTNFITTLGPEDEHTTFERQSDQSRGVRMLYNFCMIEANEGILENSR